MKRRKVKAERYRGFSIRKRVYPSGAVSWRLEIAKGKRGVRDRTTYTTLAAAKAAADQKFSAVKSTGNQAFDLTDQQRREAVEAIGLLKGDASLIEAARCWMRYNTATTKGQLFKELVAAYVANLKKAGRRFHTIKSARVRLARMAKDLGPLPAARISPSDLENWLDSQDLAGVNRRNFITIARAFYNWAMESGAVEYNPADRVKRPDTDKNLPVIFNLETVGKIMHGAEAVAPDCVAYLAVCFFAGLRPMNEAGRATWESVDLENNTLRVIPEVAKTRRARLVTIAPNLRAWLQRYRLANKGAQIAPAPMTLRRRIIAVKKKAGVTVWPKDVARHCYASAHLALYSDIQKTCLELGHTSPQMLFTHYRNLMSAKQAAEYFAILPAGNAAAVTEPQAATAGA